MRNLRSKLTRYWVFAWNHNEQLGGMRDHQGCAFDVNSAKELIKRVGKDCNEIWDFENRELVFYEEKQ